MIQIVTKTYIQLVRKGIKGSFFNYVDKKR